METENAVKAIMKISKDMQERLDKLILDDNDDFNYDKHSNMVDYWPDSSVSMNTRLLWSE